jgi:hypothetical protein
MIKQLALAAGLLTALISTTGCMGMVGSGLESVGGYGACSGCTSKGQMIIRQQARNARNIEEFVDTYFWNYDIHDPYRGDLKVLDGRGCCESIDPCCGK